MMYFQKVVDGQLVDHPVEQSQVPTGNENYFPLGDMQPPPYNPTEKTLIDHGIQLDADGMPYRKWEVVDGPEIEMNEWQDTIDRASLELFKSQDQATNPAYDDYRAALQDILNNAELESPTGDPDSVVWPDKPE